MTDTIAYASAHDDERLYCRVNATADGLTVVWPVASDSVQRWSIVGNVACALACVPLLWWEAYVRPPTPARLFVDALIILSILFNAFGAGVCTWRYHHRPVRGRVFHADADRITLTWLGLFGPRHREASTADVRDVRWRSRRRVYLRHIRLDHVTIRLRKGRPIRFTLATRGPTADQTRVALDQLVAGADVGRTVTHPS